MKDQPPSWTTTMLTHASVFDMIESNGHECLAIPVYQKGSGAEVPETVITAGEARMIVRDHGAPTTTRDAVWATLLRLVQADPKYWEPTVLWVALRLLRGIANRLYWRWQTDKQEIQSEVVLAFIETIRSADPDRPGIGTHLWWTTFRQARKACWRATREVASEHAELLSSPQIALDEAVSSRTSPDIGSTYQDGSTMEGERLGSLATRCGLRSLVDSHQPDGGTVIPFAPRRPRTCGQRPARRGVREQDDRSGEAA